MDTGIDLALEKGFPKLDLTILHVCQQLRTEAFETLARKNTWIKLTAQVPNDLRDEFNCLSYLPTNLFAPHENEELLSHVALDVKLDRPVSTGDDTTDTTLSSTLICVSVASQEQLTSFSLSPEVHSMPLTLALGSTVYHKPSMVANLLLPFTRLRKNEAGYKCNVLAGPYQHLADTLMHAIHGKNTTAQQYYNHMLALKEEEEGVKMFERGHTKVAIEYFLEGCGLYDNFHERLVENTLSMQPEMMAVSILNAELARKLVRACNIITESYRDEEDDLTTKAVDVIPLAMHAGNWAFAWLGLSDSERQMTHYLRGVARRNFAEYCALPHNRRYLKHHPIPDIEIIGPVREIYRKAALDLFYA